MALTTEQTFAYLGMLLGTVFALAVIFPFAPVKFYIPSLLNWKYFRVVTIPPTPHQTLYTSQAVLMSFDLPRDTNFLNYERNINFRDIRVTMGSGSSESLLPAMVYNNKLYVLFPKGVPSHLRTLRIYYGNPSAPEVNLFQSPPPHIVYYVPTYNRFTPSDWDVQYAGPNWARPQFSGRYLSILHWGPSFVRIAFKKQVPLAYDVHINTYPYRWSNLYAYFPVGTCDYNIPSTYNASKASTYVQALISRCPTGVLIHTTHSRNYVVQVYNKGTVVYTTHATYFLHLHFFRYGDRTAVTFSFGDAHPIYLDALLRRIVIYAASSPRGYMFINDFRVFNTYLHYSSSVSYSLPMLAPKAPVITDVNVPRVLPTHNYTLTFNVSDPNNDLNYATVSLDGNVIATFTTPGDHSVDLNLPDGNHAIQIHAIDDTNIPATYTTSVTVDTIPPRIDANASYTRADSTLHIHYVVTDATPVTVYYTTPTAKSPVYVDCNVGTPYDLNVTLSPGAKVSLCAKDIAGNKSCMSFTAPEDKSPITDVVAVLQYSTAKKAESLSVVITPTESVSVYTIIVALGLLLIVLK